MCGIAGMAGRRDPELLLRMRDALEHRGPDGRGQRELGDCSLAHTRLAIVDLEGGAQPMSDPGASLTVSFNGEIYNQQQLRAELQEHGYRFRSQSDTEVLLHGFRHWGQALWQKLEGIFAVAFWEPQQQQLTLARDRFGVKPLLWKKDPQRLAFASELSALVASGCCSSQELNPNAIESYLLWGSVAELDRQ